ncbi:MAG: hypothetical protein AMXMBFR84_40570 [Candidatus Hydrogenedentota bacterium]
MAFGGENSESYYDDGLTASMKGDFVSAIRCFEKAVKLDSSNAAAYHQLGKCYMRIGDGAKAVDILMHVVGKRPGQTLARLDLGYALLNLGRTAEARRQFEQIISTDPGSARGMLGLAQACFDEGNWQAAMTNAQHVVDRGGSNFSALFLLGRAARLSGWPDIGELALERADKLIEKSIELNPEQPEGHYFRGEVLFVREKYSSALECYRAAEDRLDRQHADKIYTAFGEQFTGDDLLAKQGLCYQRLGSHDRAKEFGERLLKRNPEHKIGQALAGLGSPEE